MRHKFLTRLLGGAAIALMLTTFPALMSRAQAPAPTPAPAQPQQQKPNIILIVADDLGYGDTGPYGGGEGRGMPTPNIDRLSGEGMTLFSFLHLCGPRVVSRYEPGLTGDVSKGDQRLPVG